MIERPPKIVLVGAGSQDFGVETLSGLVREREALAGSTVVLVDVDEAALAKIATVASRMNGELGTDFEFSATPDRREALDGADFVVVSVEVDRMEAWRQDWQIPLRYGFRHIMGENGGPGGLSHALRTAPLVLDICRDVEEMAPGALVINYSNPMSRVCLAVSRYTSLKLVGLCHQFNYVWGGVGRILGAVSSPPYTDEARMEQRELAEWLDVRACGINHLTFMTELRDRRTGRDLYPEFRQRLHEFDPCFDPIARRVDEVFGLYPIQGDGHLGEYLGGLAAGEHPGPEFELWAERGARFAGRLASAVRGETPIRELLGLDRLRDEERAIAVIAGVVEGRNSYEPTVNVVNNGCIPNLPDWAVVELPGVIGSGGVRGLSMEPLPPAAAALLNQQIAVQDLVVEAAVHGDRRAALQALLLDPLTGADPVAAEAMLDELLRTHQRHLPQFAGYSLVPAPST